MDESAWKRATRARNHRAQLRQARPSCRPTCGGRRLSAPFARQGYAASHSRSAGARGAHSSLRVPILVHTSRKRASTRSEGSWRTKSSPEDRGRTGYGAALYKAIVYGGQEVDDVLSAYDYLKTLPYVDPERVGVMGWSHGGFIAAHLLFRGATPFGSGAAIVPVTNLIFRLSYKGPGYQRSFSTQAGLRGLPFEKREEYVLRSPYYHVDSLRVPILVHVASNDTDVNFEEASPLIDALIARKPQLAETKIYWNPTPGPFSGGHSFSRRVNRETLERDDSPEQIDSWNRTWAFFERTLRRP